MVQHQDNSALLRAYRAEWEKFFTQCSYLPKPFQHLESILKGKSSSQKDPEESIIRNLMLSGWDDTIFMDIKHRLQEGSMDLVDQERLGKMFDSQLVIGEVPMIVSEGQVCKTTKVHTTKVHMWNKPWSHNRVQHPLNACLKSKCFCVNSNKIHCIV